MTDSLDLRKVRAIVTDANVLGRLEPTAVATYLQRTGWVQVRTVRGGGVWAKRSGSDDAQMLVPSDQRFGDYAIRMTEVLTALALTEDRSQLAVLVDLYAVAEVEP